MPERSGGSPSERLVSKHAFLSFDEVLAIHARLIHRYGGSLGIRDRGLLESALAMPRMTFGGELLHGTLFEMAAAYLFHIVKNHPFVDGNKRAGLACGLVFLGLNEHRVVTTNDALVELVLGVVDGRTPKSEVAVFLERHAHVR